MHRIDHLLNLDVVIHAVTNLWFLRIPGLSVSFLFMYLQNNIFLLLSVCWDIKLLKNTVHEIDNVKIPLTLFLSSDYVNALKPVLEKEVVSSSFTVFSFRVLQHE